MKIAILSLLFFVTNIFFFAVNCKPVKHFKSISFPDDAARIKKRNEDSSNFFLEQCGIVKFENFQPGIVNVLAFLDSSWPYSHRQAIMLKMLKQRLEKSGLPDTIFFIVNVSPYFSLNFDATEEDDIEREAWLRISPEEIERFAEIDKTFDLSKEDINSDIKIIQDNEDRSIWKELGGSRDQVLVIDRCGKLTYQVIVPWSILHFPYVKAAILSTYKDQPCGPCNTKMDDIEKNHFPVDSIQSDVISSDTETFGRKSTSEHNLETTTMSEEISTPFLFAKDYDYSTIQSDTGRSTGEILTSDFEGLENNLSGSEDDETTLINFEATGASGIEEIVETSTEETASYEEEDSTIVSLDFQTDNINYETTTNNYEETNPEKMHHFSDETTDAILNVSSTEIRHFDDESTSTKMADASFYSVTISGEFDVEEITETTTQDFEAIDKTTEAILEIVTSKPEVVSSDSLTIIDNFETEDILSSTRNDYETTTSNIIDEIDSTLREEIAETNTPKINEIREDSSKKKSMQKNEEKISSETKMANEDDGKFPEVPIRIIMHAPHFHVDGDSTRMHEYVVLKTGDAKNHGHLSSYDATRLYSGPQDYYVKVENSMREEIEKKKWGMKNIIYNRDESTGLFGEVADFWRDLGSFENYEDTDETEKPEDIYEEVTTDEKLWLQEPKMDDEKLENVEGKIEQLQADEIITEVAPGEEEMKESNSKEEEIRNKLIAHYSKLLPWIYYVLEK